MTEANNHLRAELESRIRFETLITDISARFISLPFGMVDTEIEHALKRVLDFFEGDRCGILEVRQDKRFVQVTHICYAEGIEPVSKDINLVDLFPWCYEKLIHGQPVIVERMTDLPPEARQDRISWTAMATQSNLTIPLFGSQGIPYLFAIQSIHHERTWPREFIPRLTLLGEIFINSLERRNADQALRESESRLNLAAESVGVGLWTLDMATGIFWLTRKARQLFSFPPEGEITFEQFLNVVYPEDHGLIHQAVDQALHSKENCRVQYRIICPDGGIRWIASSGSSHTDVSREMNRLMGACVDITERILTEKVLFSTQIRLEAGADLTGLGCYEVDFEEPSSFVDARFSAICGVPCGRQEGLETVKLWMDRLHPDDRQRIIDDRIRLHEGVVDRVDLEYRYLHPTAGQKWIHHLARVAARNAAGHMIRSYGVIQDITERKRMLERIQAAAEEWRVTFDAIQDMILVLDRDFRILHLNKSAESFWGRPRDQLAGRYCYESVLWGDMPFRDCPVKKAYDSKHHEECEFHLAQRGVWFLVSVDPVFDPEGNIMGAITIFKDITDRKRYEEELVDNRAVQHLFTRRLLTIQEEERRRLARELHDDFSQRLAVLAMELSTLEALPQPSGKTFESTLHSIRSQIIELSTDIHDISRQLHPSIIDDFGLGRAIQSECSGFTQRTGIRIHYQQMDLPRELNREISVVLFRITQEALRNIHKHARVNEAAVHLAVKDSHILLTIQDMGTGFDSENNQQSHGLGLFSMQERVQLVHGQLSIHSVRGQGTEIKVVVPLKKE